MGFKRGSVGIAKTNWFIWVVVVQAKLISKKLGGDP